MLTQEQNDLLTRVGPATPGGKLLRRFWQPAALRDELPAGGAPLPIRLLGEDLVLFRGEQGRPGLLSLHCSHRGADLSYGRLEDGGLRCIYHGWLYDIQGHCLEQPGEPAGSRFHEKIQHTAYPCQEQGGIIFAYLGPGEPPQLPNYEFLLAPDEYRTNSKGFQDCNYLQGNEGNIDPVHLSFLHRMLAPGPGWNGQRASRNGERSGQGQNPQRTTQAVNSFYGRDLAPTIEIELAEFGVRIFSARRTGPDQIYFRISNFIFPNLSAFPGGQSRNGYSVNWHVPIDDEHHWKYTISFSRGEPMEARTRQGGSSEIGPDYHLVRQRANRYLQDREEMHSRSFAGLGNFFMAQDACATEGAGPIQDRTQEHLGSTDKAIVAARLQLLKAIQDVQAGRDPMHLVRDPEKNRFPFLGAVDPVIPASFDWRRDWKELWPELAHATS